VESLVDHHHPPTGASYNMINFSRTAPPVTVTAHLKFRCQHYPPDGHGPCGELIDGDISDALEHFARVHVHPGSATGKWICQWQGQCGIPMLKGNFKRHVTSHLLRWECMNCTHTFSRDDYANKHARSCGSMERKVVMVPIVHLDSDSESE